MKILSETPRYMREHHAKDGITYVVYLRQLLHAAGYHGRPCWIPTEHVFECNGKYWMGTGDGRGRYEAHRASIVWSAEIDLQEYTRAAMYAEQQKQAELTRIVKELSK